MFEKPKVLICDLLSDEREKLRSTFRNHNCDAWCVSGLELGLAAVRDGFIPNLLIYEPLWEATATMRGWQFITNFRQMVSPSYPRAIAYSTRSHQLHRALNLECGANEFVQKYADYSLVLRWVSIAQKHCEFQVRN